MWWKCQQSDALDFSQVCRWYITLGSGGKVIRCDIDMEAAVAVKRQGWLILRLQLICFAQDHPTSTHSNALYLGDLCVCVCVCLLALCICMFTVPIV